MRRRRPEIASLRGELTEIALALEELRRAYDPRLRSYVLKYSPNQPRVPAGNPDGGQWTSEGRAPATDHSQILSDATPDNAWKPSSQYAALAAGTRTDATESTPSNSQTQDDTTNGLTGLADAANDNLTPEQTCLRAYSDAVARARINPSLNPADYLQVRLESAESLDFCLHLANGERPISRGGDFVFFHGGGVVIFRPGSLPLYVLPPGRQ